MGRWGHWRCRALPRLAVVAVTVLAAASAAACGPAPSGAPATVPSLTVPSASAATDREQVTALLDARSAAVVASDRAAFLTTSDPSPATQTDHDRLFRRISALRWSSWSYSVVRTTVLPMQAAGAVRVRVEAVLRSTLAGVGDGGAQTAMVLELARSGPRWHVVDERGASAPELWDADGVTTERFDDGLVIGVGGVPPAELRELGRLQERAVEEVAATLGVRRDGWILIVPADAGRMASLLDREPGSVDRIAAITMPAGPVTEPGGDRVWVNRSVFTGLDPAGQLIVLRHEAVHLLTGAGRSSAAPMWLEEGLAEYIGYLGSGVQLRDAAGALLEHSNVPRSLPPDSRFDGADDRVAVAYNEALTAAVWLADSLGGAGLVDLYQQVTAAAPVGSGGGARSTAAHRIDRHLRAHGLSSRELVSGWRHAVASWMRDGSRRL